MSDNMLMRGYPLAELQRRQIGIKPARVYTKLHWSLTSGVGSSRLDVPITSDTNQPGTAI